MTNLVLAWLLMWLNDLSDFWRMITQPPPMPRGSVTVVAEQNRDPDVKERSMKACSSNSVLQLDDIKLLLCTIRILHN